MRFVFLIPDLYPKPVVDRIDSTLRLLRFQVFRDLVRLKMMPVEVAHGGALNIMRHCEVARACGVDAVLATMRGIDTYGEEYGLYNLPFIRWADRRPDDICIIPDYVTELMNEIEGQAIAYLQVPIHTHNNFDYRSDRVTLWTDSPYMEDICRATYPGKAVEIVPNIIDPQQFPFIPQAQREEGLLFAFPRKNPEYITATEACYRAMGGTFWKFQLVDGLSIHELTQQFTRPQVFLASADMEGCALPPQESMAAGIVVVGRTAKGANFCMEHGETAMTAETPEAAARCLLELENAELRDRLSKNAHRYISQFFPNQAPRAFWQRTIAQYQKGSSAKFNPIAAA
jgi:glycosyltransferase involved in cell wall biosynthesis